MSTEQQYKNRQCLVFNGVLFDLINDVRKKASSINKSVKSNYTVFDRSAQEHMQHWTRQLEGSRIKELLSLRSDLLDQQEVIDLEVCKGVRVIDILTNAIPDLEGDRGVLRVYLYILMTILHIDSFVELDDSARTVLLLKTVRSMSDAKASKDGRAAYESSLDEVFDDHLRDTLMYGYDLCRQSEAHNPRGSFLPQSEKEGEASDDMFSFLPKEIFHPDNKIGSLAKEIADQITSDMGDSSEELDMSSVLNNNGGLLSKIVGKVGDTINTKFKSGELDQEVMMKDAMKIWEGMQNKDQSDLLNSMMGAMGNATKEQPRPKSRSSKGETVSVKQRLQRKLIEKKAMEKESSN